MTSLEALPRLIPRREPLPPQRWGFLPTEEFWHLAALTPISFVFWLGAMFFYDWLASLGWTWWQNGLGVAVFTAAWAGLVERWSRKYLARRRVRALTSPEGATLNELMPADEPSSGLPIFATSEFWDYAFARLFGRAKVIAAMVFEFVCFMAAFYPSWGVFFGSIGVVVAISLGLGWWQRRLIRSQRGGCRAIDGASPRASALPPTTRPE